MGVARILSKGWGGGGGGGVTPRVLTTLACPNSRHVLLKVKLSTAGEDLLDADSFDSRVFAE